MNITKNGILIAMPCTLLAFSVSWAGFDTAPYKIDICRSSVTKYVTAEFSEVETGIDFEGEMYSEVNSWSESASEVYSETVTNESPVYPPMPPHDISFSQESNFDRFRMHTDATLTVEAFNLDERTVFSENIAKAGGCLSKIGNTVNVKTWYSVSYGSDFTN